ncbi:FMN-binding domain-containing protein [Limimonas halophila]|uniref:FMN-binding domain-containing protein n=1 Tax=Limimonas halophila TaxID=1082479 RepID=A0A1G7MAR9_9PROT|nr:FMN-binding protein [Limimonas halophila]SDF58339.1 FMN-binding domain-containing protein [Limimonas halophila]
MRSVPTGPVLIGLALLALALPAWAADVYQEPDAFIAGAFDGEPPSDEVLWITGEVKAGLKRVLGDEPNSLRMRYWQRGDRTAWILERIGKHEPITTGVVVEDGAVQRIKVLIYRESRGWEVREDFFTQQFDGATLNAARDGLDRYIDGISGATLSVRALTNIAEMALVLHGAVTGADGGDGES